MRRCLFPLIFVCLLAAVPAFSQRVIEGESSFAIVGNEGVVRLAVESATASNAEIRLDLIDFVPSLWIWAGARTNRTLRQEYSESQAFLSPVTAVGVTIVLQNSHPTSGDIPSITRRFS